MVPQLPNLFQYWDGETPPDEVTRLLVTWQGDPAFRHRLFTERLADSYIAEHADPRVLAAFRVSRYGAMQSDLFRLVALWVEGGVYIDADIGNKGGLPELLAPTKKGMILRMTDGLANQVIFVREPRDPLLWHLMWQAVENVEARASNNVALVTGPEVFRALHEDPATRHLFDGFTIEPRERVGKAVNFKAKMAYKDTAADWRRAAYFPDHFSIYRDG